MKNDVQKKMISVVAAAAIACTAVGCGTAKADTTEAISSKESDTAVEAQAEGQQTTAETGEKTEITLPKSNVLSFELEGGNKVIVRPSGTEPKIKAYYTATEATMEAAKKIEAALDKEFTALLSK
jgi:phosphomannomutase